jgi:hypothetical protein
MQGICSGRTFCYTHFDPPLYNYLPPLYHYLSPLYHYLPSHYHFLPSHSHFLPSYYHFPSHFDFDFYSGFAHPHALAHRAH